MPELAPVTAEGAYRVQDEVMRALDGDRRPVAWKVSPPKPGAAPQASPVPASGLRSSPARVAAEGRVLGIEAEIAFRLRSDVGAWDHGADDTEALALIELCSTRYANWNDADPFSRLADFQSHGAFALGTATREWRGLDMRVQEVELRIDGSLIKHAVGSHPTCDLETMLRWAFGHCASRGWPLRAGDIVTTGSWTGITPLGPGREALAIFPGIGEARLTLEP